MVVCRSASTHAGSAQFRPVLVAGMEFIVVSENCSVMRYIKCVLIECGIVVTEKRSSFAKGSK